MKGEGTEWEEEGKKVKKAGKTQGIRKSDWAILEKLSRGKTLCTFYDRSTSQRGRGGKGKSRPAKEGGGINGVTSIKGENIQNGIQS